MLRPTMIAALAWLEQTPPSVFMREDFYAYFVALILHAWGMAMLVFAAVIGLTKACAADYLAAGA